MLKVTKNQIVVGQKMLVDKPLYFKNDGMHDFGYPCSMPKEITIDGLFVDDSNHPEGYDGMYIFPNYDNSYRDAESDDQVIESPFPYKKCQKMTVRGLSTASGKKPRISSNADMENSLVVEEAR
jgi:hypothetical protein